MYDLEHSCQYQNYLNNENVNLLYQNDLLKVFGKSEYSDLIMTEITNLYQRIKEIPEFVELLSLVMKNLEDSIPLVLMSNNNEPDLEYGLIGLYSFEYFHHFNPIMQKFFKKEDYTQEITSFKNLLKNNKVSI